MKNRISNRIKEWYKEEKQWYKKISKRTKIASSVIVAIMCLFATILVVLLYFKEGITVEDICFMILWNVLYFFTLKCEILNRISLSMKFKEEQEKTELKDEKQNSR